MYRISLLIFVFSCLLFNISQAQQATPEKIFTHADTLRGSVTPERAWWDVLRYDISLVPDYGEKFIRGANRIRFKVLNPGRFMQIDLQEPMKIQSAVWREQPLKFERTGNVFIVEFPEDLLKDETETLTIQFEGHPREAVKPPWDGGWIWTRDQLGRPWMTVTCQGIGASVWYPCKDYQGDEPDSGASLSVTVADTLVVVANGRLREKKNNNDGTATYSWSVANPINNYCLLPYIGKYVDITDRFPGEKGLLNVDYWVLDYNREKARAHMQPEVQRMLRCFEHWFGPYPFYEDGYKMVDAPYVGMENQSAIAYGNRYENGYLGRDQSGTGWGNKWDFIIVHESGHEWFANSITAGDLADWWVHEGFTTYSETLFTEYYFGRRAGNAYNHGLRKHILNDEPVIGPYGVNYDGTQDAYYKASSMIHNIRQIIDNDSLFRQILKGLNHDFYHETVTSGQIERYISQHAKKDFSKVFDQYLRTAQVPVLEYKIEGHKLSYRWTNCVRGFDMPLKIHSGKERWIKPGEEWKSSSWYTGKTLEFSVDPNFYINVKKLD
jgi:aminopeptidase N